MRRLKLNSLPNEKGSIAIIMVMGAIAMITAIGIEITYRAKLSTTLVANRRDAAKAYQLAKAAYRWSTLRLQIDSKLDSIPPIPGTIYGGKKDDLLEMQWNMPIQYPFPIKSMIPDSEQATPESLGGTFTSMIYDESARLNINDVGSFGTDNNRRWTGTSEVLENLLLSPRFAPFRKGKDHRNLMWAVEDWVDSDSAINHLAGGVEDAEYRVDLPDFKVKNGPFYTLNELKLLNIMNDGLFRELEPFVTVYPFDTQLPRSSGAEIRTFSKINVNTAPVELIAAVFNRQILPSPQDRLQCAQLVAKFRQEAVFRDVAGQSPTSFLNFLRVKCRMGTGEENQSPITPATQKILSVSSDVFRIEAIGIVNNVTKTIHAVVFRGDPKKIKLLFWEVS